MTNTPNAARTRASARARFGFLVHDVSRMRRTFFDQALKPHGITRAQWWALGNLSRHAEEGMIQTELAKVLDIGKVSVGGLIDRLEDAGLVYRRNDAADRRVKRIFITDKGFDLLDRIAVVGGALDEQLFGDIPAEALEGAIETLARVKAHLRTALQGEGEGVDAGEGEVMDATADVAPFRVRPTRATKPARRRRAG